MEKEKFVSSDLYRGRRVLYFLRYLNQKRTLISANLFQAAAGLKVK